MSLVQTNWVIDELKKKDPEHDFEIRTIKTKGDTDARPLFTIDQKGIFEKEIDRAVADGTIDFAVHSLKDIPSQLIDGLVLACVPKREDVNDVFISSKEYTLHTIPAKSVIGTSSLRRAVQISRIRSDVAVKPVRGNIESRIRKVKGGIYDAIVLAQAGINRLGLDVKYTKLSLIDFPPSPGQGAIGIVCRQDDNKTLDLLKRIEDPDSRAAIESERTLSRFVDSGCRFPLGAYGEVNGSDMTLTVVAYSIDGTKSLIVKKTGPKNKPEDLGRQAAEDLKEEGIQDLAKNWRKELDKWNK